MHYHPKRRQLLAEYHKPTAKLLPNCDTAAEPESPQPVLRQTQSGRVLDHYCARQEMRIGHSAQALVPVPLGQDGYPHSALRPTPNRQVPRYTASISNTSPVAE
jgi:hypothetical protein